MLDSKSYESRVISEWDELIEVFNKFSRSEAQWIFRGHGNSTYCLETNLERALKSFRITEDALRIEGGLLRRFKRQCHHYGVNIPESDDIMEWFALMRHYGAPTRILDWSYSFFVALYFALENAHPKKGCAVWALNTDWMVERVKSILGDALWQCFKDDENIRKQTTFKKLFVRKEPIKVVLAITPYRLNERLTIQQGIFLCPGDVSKPFEDNLDTLCLSDPDFQGNLIKYEIHSTPETRKDFLNKLRRMNINRATLFPGLDGFAKSLNTLLASPDILVPDQTWDPY